MRAAASSWSANPKDVLTRTGKLRGLTGASGA